MPFFMSFFQSSVRRQPWDPFKVLFSYSLNENILSQINYLSKRLQEGVVTADAMMRAERNDASSQVFLKAAGVKKISQFCLEVVSKEI